MRWLAQTHCLRILTTGPCGGSLAKALQPARCESGVKASHRA